MKTVNVINNLQKEYQDAFRAWVNANTGQEFNYARVKTVEIVTTQGRASFMVSSITRTHVLNA